MVAIWSGGDELKYVSHSIWIRFGYVWCSCSQLSHGMGDNPPPHDDVIEWKHFPPYWPCVRGIHRLPVNSPHKGQWRGALMIPLIGAWITGWVNNHEGGDLRRHRAHYDVIVMKRGPFAYFLACAVGTIQICFSCLSQNSAHRLFTAEPQARLSCI